MSADAMAGKINRKALCANITSRPYVADSTAPKNSYILYVRVVFPFSAGEYHRSVEF